MEPEADAARAGRWVALPFLCLLLCLIVRGAWVSRISAPESPSVSKRGLVTGNVARSADTAGIWSRTRRPPAQASADGFDAIRVFPMAGEEFRLGHLLLRE